jgi:ABC-type phosphate/phosphonate transport system substrate-binding protein
VSFVASFRMYNACPGAAAAWRALFTRAFADAGIQVEMIAHAFPQPLESLWADPRLFGDFMCGWPFSRAEPPMRAIAAPVPSPARYAGLPRYCTDYVVREDNPARSLEETFGQRFGWMAANSNSGFNAPRAHLAGFARARGPALFAESVGPLGNPAKTLAALREERVDVVAVDGFYLDLLRHHEPARLDGLRVAGSTPWAPIPLLVAAPGTDAVRVEMLRSHIVSINGIASYRKLLADVLLERFVAPDTGAYATFEGMARTALDLGYPAIR